VPASSPRRLLAGLHAAVPRRLALYGHHQRPRPAARGPRRRQGLPLHPQPAAG